MGPSASTPLTAYRWDRLTTGSVSQWAELTNLLAEVDGSEEFYEPEDLAEELREHGFDPELDSWAVWDGDTMVAYGQLRVSANPDHEGRVRCSLSGGVHPQWRGRGIGRELMDRMERRAVELAAQRHPGLPAYWRADGGIEGAHVRAMLQHRGYRTVRYFNLLTRPLPGEPLAEAADAELVSPGPEHEEALLVAHNQAFRDHWGATEVSPESWHDHWTARSSRPEVSTLALGPEGEVLSYVLCGQWVPRELYVNLVGTVPSARGRGLAAACLGRTIALAGRSGDYDVIELDVDTESLTGATRLYERVGFTVKKTFASMQREATG